MMTKQKTGFHWSRITFIFLGLLILAALMPVTTAALTGGDGTEENPFTTDKDFDTGGAIQVHRCQKDGTIIETLDSTGDQSTLTLEAGQTEPIYLKVTYDNNQEIKGGSSLKTLWTPMKSRRLELLRE